MSFAFAVPALPRPSAPCQGLLAVSSPATSFGPASLDGRVVPAGFGQDRPPVSDDRLLPTTAAIDGGLDLTLSATDDLVVVALAAAKSAIMAVLRIEEDNFTLGPAVPELFVATFRHRELRDRSLAASVSRERPLSGSLLEHSGAATPVMPVGVPPVEVPPSVEVVPAVEMPPVNVLPSAEIMVPAFEEATDTVGASEDDNSAALEEFISKVLKNIPPPLVDKPPRRRRVDPVLVDEPPQLPSSEVHGLR